MIHVEEKDDWKRLRFFAFLYNIYVFSIPFKNSYGCIGIIGDTYIVDNKN